jgi:hypothetical protein
MLAAFAAGSRGLFTILGKIARPVLSPFVPLTLVPNALVLLAVVLGPLLARLATSGTLAAVAGLTALAAGFSGPLPIPGKVAGTVLATNMSGARGLFTILSKISRIAGVAFSCHGFLFPALCKAPGSLRRT